MTPNGLILFPFSHALWLQQQVRYAMVHCNHFFCQSCNRLKQAAGSCHKCKAYFSSESHTPTADAFCGVGGKGGLSVHYAVYKVQICGKSYH